MIVKDSILIVLVRYYPTLNAQTIGLGLLFAIARLNRLHSHFCIPF